LIYGPHALNLIARKRSSCAPPPSLHPVARTFSVLIVLRVQVSFFFFTAVISCFMLPVTCTAMQNVVSRVHALPRSSCSRRTRPRVRRSPQTVHKHTHTMRLKGASLDICLSCFRAFCWTISSLRLPICMRLPDSLTSGICVSVPAFSLNVYISNESPFLSQLVI
jgi:hypothetical protein